MKIRQIKLSILNERYYIKDWYLYNKNTNSNNSKKDETAGWKKPSGYYVSIDKKSYAVHRIIYQMVNSIDILPNDKVIDHIDGNPHNNNINNLRLCLQSENTKNTSGHKDNQLGIKGVTFCKSRQKYVSQIMCDGRKIQKRFDDIEDAKIWYVQQAKLLFGKYNRT